ncbi:unnamed protein product [Prunus armeniaca]
MKRQRNEHEACTRSPIFKIQVLGLEPLSQLATSDEHPRQFLSMPEEAPADGSLTWGTHCSLALDYTMPV